MRIAIVHYHLKPGGVTRVIENTCSSLTSLGIEVACLSGEAYTGNKLSNVAIVDGLNYNTNPQDIEGRRLGQNLMDKAKEAFDGQAPDLWHIHNHSLGKNIHFLEALNKLIHEAQSVFLQIHDFAEDGRPSNYENVLQGLSKNPEAQPYPLAETIHYAVLNQRDYRFLNQAGIPQNNLHLLPNPIEVEGGSSSKTSTRPPKDPFPGKILHLYPTRAIRRKNLGELLFHAAYHDKNHLFATTLAPQNPQWRSYHDRWVKVAAEEKLPIEFALGARYSNYSFHDWMKRADTIISTSIAEGFGLAFLEPFLFDKPLEGRDIPEITQDFKTSGIDLENLYSNLPIPLELISQSQLEVSLTKGLEGLYHAYGIPLPENASEKAMNSQDGTIDFAILDEALQEEVIRKVNHSQEWKDYFRHKMRLNPTSPESIQRNKSEILSQYNLDQYGNRIADIYRQIQSSHQTSPAIKSIPRENLLKAFLSPEHFRLLRSR